MAYTIMTYIYGMYNYDLYSYGLYICGLYSYGLYSWCIQLNILNVVYSVELSGAALTTQILPYGGGRAAP